MNKAKERRIQSSWNGSNSILFLDDPLFPLDPWVSGSWFVHDLILSLYKLFVYAIKCVFSLVFKTDFLHKICGSYCIIFQWGVHVLIGFEHFSDSLGEYASKLKEFCKPHKCYVDEHYFQTMITINTPHLLANRSLTYVDWSSFMLIHLVQPIIFGATSHRLSQ